MLRVETAPTMPHMVLPWFQIDGGDGRQGVKKLLIEILINLDFNFTIQIP